MQANCRQFSQWIWECAKMSWTGKSWPNKNVMIEYKTQKKERYYSEVIRLYTELGISPEYFHSVMVLLSAGCLSLQKKNAKIMNQPWKKKSSTTQNHMDSVLFRLFQFVSVFDSLLVMIWFSFGFVSVVSVIDFHLVLISFEFGFSFVFLIK